MDLNLQSKCIVLKSAATHGTRQNGICPKHHTKRREPWATGVAFDLRIQGHNRERCRGAGCSRREYRASSAADRFARLPLPPHPQMMPATPRLVAANAMFSSAQAAFAYSIPGIVATELLDRVRERDVGESARHHGGERSLVGREAHARRALVRQALTPAHGRRVRRDHC